jgi:glycerol-3-phosphate dehydrogenase
VNIYFRDPVGPERVVWAFAGVRSLYDDGSRDPEDLTRDYVLDLEEPFHEAPLLTIYGGKITTYRRLAEHAMDKISHFFVPRRPWTAKLPLPGGDFAPKEIGSRVAQAQATWPFLTPYNAARLVHAYGTRLDRVLGSARTLDDLGPRFGADLTAAEVRYQMQHEWAMTADDVLWRRTKLGLRVSVEQREALARFMAETIGRNTAA